MRVLVAGASGLLGQALSQKLVVQGTAVMGASRKQFPGSATLDLSSAKAVQAFLKENRFDLVVNCAAFSDVDGCEKDPAQAWSSNAAAVKNLADACSARGSALLHVSTDYVFDGRSSRPYTEKDAVGPVNAYGLTKLAGEEFVKMAVCPSAVVRTSWLFGAGNPANFVNQVAKRLREEPLVRVLDDQTDAPTYAADLADALFAMAPWLVGAGGGYRGTYQFTNAGATTRLEMTRVMRDLSGSRAEVARLDASQLKARLAIRPVRCVMSTEKFENEFAWKIRPWQEAMNEYLTGPGRV